MIHHLLSHTDSADWLKVNQFFVEQLAYVARKLDAIQEGERTALDNSIIMYCSSMLTGGHDATPAPGRDPRPRRRPARRAAACSTTWASPNRKMCSLFLSLMDKFGVRLPEFGDSRERLPEVTAV